MLLKEIEPINQATVHLSLFDDTDSIIDEIIELPLRTSCKILFQKGIETIMSSANKNNITKPGEKAIEKEDVYGSIEKLFETHTFLEAGKGYAWIMLNFDSLSDENKDLLFQLEDTMGQNIIWFAHPTEMSGNIEFSLKIGTTNYNILSQCLEQEMIPKKIEIDARLIEFEKRHIVLLYPWIDASTEAAFLRMPINEQTTVEEVEEYFANLARHFYNQAIRKDPKEEDKDIGKSLVKHVL